MHENNVQHREQRNKNKKKNRRWQAKQRRVEVIASLLPSWLKFIRLSNWNDFSKYNLNLKKTKKIKNYFNIYTLDKWHMRFFRVFFIAVLLLSFHMVYNIYFSFIIFMLSSHSKYQVCFERGTLKWYKMEWRRRKTKKNTKKTFKITTKTTKDIKKITLNMRSGTIYLTFMLFFYPFLFGLAQSQLTKMNMHIIHARITSVW